MALTQVETGMIKDAAVTQAKLGANVAGNGPAFKICLTANQTISHNTNTTANFNLANIDTASCLDAANKRVIPKAAGYYNVTVQIGILETSTRTYYYRVGLTKNGSLISYAVISHAGSSGGEQILTSTSIVYCNGTTDYIDVVFYQYDYTSNSTVALSSDSAYSYISGFLARAA
jgi:hypothetical protein